MYSSLLGRRTRSTHSEAKITDHSDADGSNMRSHYNRYQNLSENGVDKVVLTLAVGGSEIGDHYMVERDIHMNTINVRNSVEIA